MALLHVCNESFPLAAVTPLLVTDNISVPVRIPKAKLNEHFLNLSTASIAIVTCFLCIVIVMTVLGNSIALIAFCIYRPLRTVTNYFLINLCISDITVAAICMPFWISYILTGWPSALSGAVYVFWVSLDIFCGTWSIMSLAMISIERYMCVGFPLYYQNLVTKRRTMFMVAFVLLYSTVSSMLGYAQSLTKTTTISITIFVLSYVVPVFIKLFTYGKIYKAARKQQKFINQNEKDRERLLGQRHLFSLDKITEEKSTAMQGFNASATVIQYGQSKDLSARKEDQKKQAIREVESQEGREIDKSSLSQKAQNLNTELDSLSIALRNIRLPSSRRLNCCCRATQIDQNSPKSLPMSSGDTETTLDLSSQAAVEKCCSDSYDELRKLGIDDWNAYLDNLEGVPSKMVTEPSCEKEKQHLVNEKERARTEVRTSPGKKQPALVNVTVSNVHLPIQVNMPKEVAKPPEEKVERNLSLSSLINSLPKVGSKQSSSRFLRGGSVKFFKSGSIIEMKQRGLCRFKRLNREVKASKVIGRIIGTFLLLWTPFMIVVVLSSLRVSVSMPTVITTKCLHYANSAINPILYIVFDKNFKKAARRLLRIFC